MLNLVLFGMIAWFLNDVILAGEQIVEHRDHIWLENGTLFGLRVDVMML